MITNTSSLCRVASAVLVPLAWSAVPASHAADACPGGKDLVLANGQILTVDAADRTVTTVQRVASELRPTTLTTLGLGPALAQEAHDFEARQSVTFPVQTLHDALDFVHS